jgi:hypothetical protein
MGLVMHMGILSKVALVVVGCVHRNLSKSLINYNLSKGAAIYTLENYYIIRVLELREASHGRDIIHTTFRVCLLGWRY